MDVEILPTSEVQQPSSDTAAFKGLFEEIVDDILFDICLTVHKAVKLDYYVYDEFIIKDGKFVLYPSYDEKGDLIVELPADSLAHSFISSLTKLKIPCSNCGKLNGITYVAIHLDKCMGLGNASRKVVKEKVAQQKIAIETVKKPPPDTVSTFKKLKPEQREERLKAKCCVLTKNTEQLCRKSLKCHLHTDKQKEDIRKFFSAC